MMSSQAKASMATAASAPSAARSLARSARGCGVARPFRHRSAGRAAAPGGRIVSVRSAEEVTALDNDTAKVEDYMKLFGMADLDGNGQLEKKEFKSLLNSFERGLTVPIEAWMTDAELDGLFAQYDSDGNGAISEEEFSSMMKDEVLLEGKLEEYEAVFKAMDTTGNGTLGANELVQFFDAVGQPASFLQIDRVMERFDKDGNGQIDFKEFLRMFRGKLIDLEDIRDYTMLNANNENVFAEGAHRLINAEAGDVSMIFSGEELDDILDAHEDRIVVVMASLTWCRPCKGFMKTYQTLSELYTSCRFVKFYGNSNERTKTLFKERLKVKGTPSFYLYKKGKIIHEHDGANPQRLEDALRKFLSYDELPGN